MPKTDPFAQGASFDPDALQVLGQSFEEAWHAIAGDFADHEVEAARSRLADIVLKLGGDGQLSPEQLLRTAVRLMRQDSEQHS